MTGANNVLLTPRRLAGDQSNTLTTTNAVTTTINSTTSSSNVSSSEPLSAVATLTKGVAPTNTGLPYDITVYMNTYFFYQFINMIRFCLSAFYIDIEEIKKNLP